MRSWQRDLAIADAQMRAEYYRRLIEVARISPALARTHTERATVDEMKVYLNSGDDQWDTHVRKTHLTYSV